MPENGKFPASALRAIPGGRLAPEPAAAWNAMLAEARHKGLALPMPDGSESSYRTFAQQVELRNEWCGKGQCGNAAIPGHSNHGTGDAVDCDNAAQRATIEKIGKGYGWAHGPGSWSDAPWEEWHNLYQPGHFKWTNRFLPLREGSTGVFVYILRSRLRKMGWRMDGGKGALLPKGRRFDHTTELIVRRFEEHHQLTPVLGRGIVDPATWTLVQRLAKKAK